MSSSTTSTSTSTSACPSASTDIVGYRENVNRCISDGLVKAAGGMAIGASVSLLFLRRRRWPIWIGAGYGIGLAYRNCLKDLKEVKLKLK
ncbi:MICOS complex subunit Mic10 [Drosophila obscura]|uniref:MICOS complex subunit Mic10 n=1 Tax=Drosophila obscura TaxID=7282 RepID=UPI000BA0801F|nr:MICOS complex subunit Mic10 [Drosophila obscura]